MRIKRVTPFRRCLLAFCLAIPLGVATYAGAVVLGYMTGNDYMGLSDDLRMGWLIGALDGLMAESVILEKDKDGPWLDRCVASYDKNQIKAIFEKQLASDPESWHAPAALILRVRLAALCGRTEGG